MVSCHGRQHRRDLSSWFIIGETDSFLLRLFGEKALEIVRRKGRDVQKGDRLPGLPVQLVVWVMTKDRVGWQRGLLQAGQRSVDVENRTYPHTQIIRIRYAGETVNPWGENEEGYLVLLGVLLGFDRLALEKSLWGDDRSNNGWRSSPRLLCVSATASIPALHVPELAEVS